MSHLLFLPLGLVQQLGVPVSIFLALLAFSFTLVFS